MSSRLQKKIEEANTQGRIALIPFLTAGFPSLDKFWIEMEELDANGADIIEIGVPFSDPVADGPVVEAASAKALEQGVSLDWIFDGLAERRGKFKAELVLMGYYNPFLQYGLSKSVEKAASVGVSGFIVPDLPLGEDGPLREEMLKNSLDLISLVGPNTSEQRMREYAEKASGYVYVVSVMGTTGVRENLSSQVSDILQMAKNCFSPLPVVLGFGVKQPEQLESLVCKPHGVVFGSALIKHLDSGHSSADFMRRWVV